MIFFRIERIWQDRSVGVWLFKYTSDGKSYVVNPTELIFKDFQDGHILPEPSFKMNDIEAEEMFRALKDGIQTFLLPIS